jgi:hypothetical protein
VDPQVAQWGLKNFLGESMPVTSDHSIRDFLLTTTVHFLPDAVAIGGDIIEVVSPFKAGTTAGRLLEKKGEGGYMIIMQTLDAAARRAYIESRALAKVIFSHSHDDVACVQYHPKGIAGEIFFNPDLNSPPPPAPPTD